MLLNKSKQINVSIPADIYNNYMRLYRGTLSRFVRNALELATQDKDIFNLIFFSEVKK